MSDVNDIEISTTSGVRVDNANGNTAVDTVTIVDTGAITSMANPTATTTSTTTITSTSVAPATATTAAGAGAVTTPPPTIIDTVVDETTNASMQLASGENNNNNNAVVMVAPLPQQQQQQQQQQTDQPPQQTQLPQQHHQQHQHQHMQTVTGKGKMDAADASLTNFKVLYVLAQLCGLTLIVLMGSWIGVYMGGLGGTSTPSLEFNWHPLLMTIGLIFLYGNSILVYRGFRSVNKKTLKLTHAAIHMGAFILTVIALKTVFDSHNLAATPIPNMYSLHSWLGLSAVIIFCLQYVVGFLAFLVPVVNDSYKILIMPLHVYFGLLGFVLAIASALMGLTEKAIFSVPNYSRLPNSGVMVNICGVLFVIFGALVVYMTTEPSYKRKSLPENTVLLTGANE